MASTAVGRLAALTSRSAVWSDAWAQLDGAFQADLIRVGLDDPITWGGLLRREEPDPRDKLSHILSALGALEGCPEDVTIRLDHAEALAGASGAIARGWADSLSQVSTVQINLDHEMARKRARAEREDTAFKKLADPSVGQLPAVWRGKAYRRVEATGDEKAQERAETKEREKWAGRLIDLLLEAQLPFGLEVEQRGLDPKGLEASRCLRGTRWTSIKKRCSDWAPVRRFLLAEEGRPFPTAARDLVRYLEVKRQGGAAKTTFLSVLGALRFLEEAGEVKCEDQLHKHPALANLAKEATAAKARAQAATGEGGKKQAPPLPLALLAALEGVVNDLERPAFQRCYAWYRLVRHWASLRFDDTSGLHPASLVRRTRGLYGVLRRTKTSGPDKQITLLPIWVSQDAWVSKEWLDTGLALWLAEPFSYARDYFLVLPTPDLAGTIGKRARYSDACCFSRALFSTLATDEGEATLHPEALSYWTEHSDRAGLDSHLAALGVSSDLRRFVGRWAPQGSEDSYVRTAVRVVENLQRYAADHGRVSLAGGADFFGEEHLLEQLRDFLSAGGMSWEEAQAQMDRLKVADYEADNHPRGGISTAGLWQKPLLQPATPIQSVSSAGVIAVDEAEDLVAAAEAAEDDQELDQVDEHQGQKELEAAVATREAGERAPPLGDGYVVSISHKGRFRRLHWSGGCWRIPGVHYHNFEWWRRAPGERQRSLQRLFSPGCSGRPRGGGEGGRDLRRQRLFLLELDFLRFRR